MKKATYEKGEQVRVTGFKETGIIVDVKQSAGQVVVRFNDDTYEQVSMYYVQPVDAEPSNEVTTDKNEMHELFLYLCKPEHLKEMFSSNPFFKNCNYDRLAIRLTLILSTVWAYLNDCAGDDFLG